jgi:hypothetical protein
MIRALGFLIGLAAVTAPAVAWLVVRGRANFGTVTDLETTADTASAFESAARVTPEPNDVSAETSRLQGARTDTPATLDAAAETPGPEALPSDVAETLHVSAETPPPIAPIEPIPDSGAAAPEPATPAIPSVTVPIWKPFRSERAARGFSEHVAEHYGVASEVRRHKPGVYQVIVSAESDEALQRQLDQLRAAAGLAALEIRP